MIIASKKNIRFDLSCLLIIVSILLIIGFIFIYSSSSVFALEKFGSPLFFVKKQLIGFVLGLFALIIARYTPLPLLEKYAGLFLIAALALTGLTLIPSLGQHVHGSSRWLSLGGMSLQPSEFLKLALMVYVAAFITKKALDISSFIRTYVPLLIIITLTSAILLQQPDFGLTATLITTVFILLFITQFHVKYLYFTLAGIIPVGIVLFCMKAYRLRRIFTFLNPWADPQGAGFQIIQSLIAIGSGGFWGLGIGQSKQKFFYLPMQHTDFIFSIIAEETGFIGTMFLILLYLLFLYFGLRLALQLQDQFSKICVLGFIIVISLQALINIAVATGVAPTKGTGLPFVSYGNTALIGQLIMVGFIINMVYNDQ